MWNNKIINIISESSLSSNDTVFYFEIISKLIKKYWQKLQDIQIQNIIKKCDEKIYFLLQVLQKYKKDNIPDIKTIVKEIKNKSEYNPSFEINMIETSTKYNIEEKIQKKFPQSTIKTKNNIDLWIFIHWGWRYYKRNIDQDLEKVLW